MDKNEDQLCWRCKKATGLCPWSHSGEAIEGWKAEKTVIYGGNGRADIPSYRIISCPLFERDEPRSRTAKKLKITFKDMAALLKSSVRTLKALEDDALKEKFRELNLELEIVSTKRRTFFVRRMKDAVL